MQTVQHVIEYLAAGKGFLTTTRTLRSADKLEGIACAVLCHRCMLKYVLPSFP
jgi:hypothetical protein